MQENTIFVKRYDANDEIFPVREREIWRYSGYLGFADGVEKELQNLLEEVRKELKNAFSYNVCYRRMKIEWQNTCKTAEENLKSSIYMPKLPFSTESKALAKCLYGSDEIIIFAATIGFEIDRYIAKYQRFSPAKALLMQAYGAERIECLCDVFCKEIKEEVAKEGLSCTPRFSPGYGDLSLEVQKEFFQLLDCQRQIGITLNDSLLMTPSKSVTAIFGLGSCVDKVSEHKCNMCKKTDCVYKSR